MGLNSLTCKFISQRNVKSQTIMTIGISYQYNKIQVHVA
jgi:hypothetical protein